MNKRAATIFGTACEESLLDYNPPAGLARELTVVLELVAATK